MVKKISQESSGVTLHGPGNDHNAQYSKWMPTMTQQHVYIGCFGCRMGIERVHLAGSDGHWQRWLMPFRETLVTITRADDGSYSHAFVSWLYSGCCGRLHTTPFLFDPVSWIYLMECSHSGTLCGVFYTSLGLADRVEETSVNIDPVLCTVLA
jgi:hypothetical protein